MVLVRRAGRPQTVGEGAGAGPCAGLTPRKTQAESISVPPPAQSSGHRACLLRAVQCCLSNERDAGGVQGFGPLDCCEVAVWHHFHAVHACHSIHT